MVLPVGFFLTSSIFLEISIRLVKVPPALATDIISATLMVKAFDTESPDLTTVTIGLLSIVSGAAADFLLEEVVTDDSAALSPPLDCPSLCPSVKLNGVIANASNLRDLFM